MSDKLKRSQDPIINAHTHIFTKDHTPKFLAKQILPWPFYMWLETGPMLKLIKIYLNRNQHEFSYTGRNKKWKAYKWAKFLTKTPGITTFYNIFLTVVWVIFGYYLLNLIKPLVNDTLLLGWLCEYSSTWLDPIMPNLGNPWNSVGLLLIIILTFRNIRRALWNYIWSQIKKAMGKEKIEFLLRYINIVRFSGKKFQASIFNDLEQQYPKGSKFAILPMDMEFMGADTVKAPYPKQMDEILRLKKNNQDSAYPFIFVDPRRIEEQDPTVPFLKFKSGNPAALELADCLVKEYVEGKCAGIKIYPALGYYVFDKNLLSLWLYCAQNNVPITTHCSIGPIYYRGLLKDLGDKYDLHPIFKEVYDKDENEEEIVKPLRLAELKNKDFQKYFTHPLNYLCLLHKPLLIKVLEHYDDKELYDLFGYSDGGISRDLSQLKINLAHYGSAEEWDKFLTQDRYDEANFILNKPEEGLDLVNRIDKLYDFYKLWHYVDWFSIISSMLLNFDNVYTDISYTSHDLKYLSLLSEILDNPKISSRVLFGTDFYVVSNHKTEKQYWIDMQNSLGPNKWGLIANQNPTEFLTSKLPGSL
jgi:hypothetical protein